MTAEEKEKLYEAIGYKDQITVTEYPKEFIENKLLFLLHNLTLILSDDTRRETQVLKVDLKEVSALVEQRPAADALRFDAKIDSFIVNGVPTEKNKYPTIVSSLQISDTNLPLLNILFETNPLDADCDQCLHIHAQPLQIFYDAITVNSLAEVFQPPEKAAFQQLQATAKMKLQDFKELSAFGLQYAIEQHKYLDLKINIQPTYIIVPENGVFEKNSHLIVISLGHFQIESEQRDPTSPNIKSMVKAGSTEDEVMSVMIDKTYDKFHIAIKNIEILLASPDDDWKSAIGVMDDTLHLLKPLSLTVDFHLSIVSVDPRFPKMRLLGELPLLKLGISNLQLTKLLTILMSIPFPEGDSLSEPAPASQFSAAVATDFVNTKVAHQAAKDAVQTYKNVSSDSDDEVIESTKTVQSTDMEVKFEIKEFGFTFYQMENGQDTEMLKFAFHNFGLQLVSRTFDMTASVYLGGILLEHLQHKTCRGEVLKIISSTLNENEDQLFSLKYMSADTKGPDFTTTYNSTLQNVNVNFTGIDVILHQESILSIMDFASNIVASLEAAKPTLPPLDTVVVKKSEVKSDMKPSEMKSFTRMKLAPKKRKSETQIIDTQLNAALGSIRLIICNYKYDLTDIRIEGMTAALTIQKSKTFMSASLKDMIVYDPTPGALYSQILSTVAGEVLDVKVAMFNNATEDENYIDMSAVDMKIGVSFGRMKIIFLNKFVSSLLFFLDHFQTAKDRIAEASAVAAEAAKQSMEEVYEKSSRISLDVVIQAPVIIVPQNSSSTNAIVADLGISTISNKFELSNKRNELGVPAIFEKISLDLQNLQLCSAIVNPENTDTETVSLILEPLSFTLQVTRNHACNWLTEVPEFKMKGNLAAVKIVLSRTDYNTVMSVLSENLTETGEETQSTPPVLSDLPTSVGSKKVVSVPVTSRTTVETVSAIIPEKIMTRFKFDFILDSVRLTLCDTDESLVNEHNAQNKFVSMAEVEIKVLKTRARVMSDSSITARVVLVDFILDDTRPTRTKGITRLMERSSKDVEDNMICIDFEQSSYGSKRLQTTVSSFSLIFCLDYIIKLGEFFSGSPSTPSNEPVQAVGKQVVPTATRSDSDSSISSAADLTVINLKVQKPDVVLIENIEDINSHAIFLNNEIDLVFKISGVSQSFSGTVKNLTFYTACFNPQTRNDTISKILRPCDIDMQCNFGEHSQHLDVIFTDLILHISPGTVQLLSGIMSSLISGPQAEETKAEENSKDYSQLWQIKSLKDWNFWFLETVEGKDALAELLDSPSSVSTEDIPQPIHQQMLVTMQKVVITIEAGVGTRTVPMLLMESSFQVQIRDWSSSLYIASSFSLEISYYNERIAVWEPLMEPIETKNGHRSWELIMEIIQGSDTIDAGTDDDEAEEILFQPPQMSVNIIADDVLELTVSKMCLDVLTNLGQAFQDAIKTTTVKKALQPFADYHINNYIGLPITIVLGNELFQILNDDNTYNKVILESGCPTLHLINSSPKEDTKARLSVLKKQDVKEETYFNIKIVQEDMNVERQISVAHTVKRFYQLPRMTYPGNRWGFVLSVHSLYGSKSITFHSTVQIHNHFTVPIDVYFMKDSLKEVEWCACVEPNKIAHLPLHAVYTATSQLFFQPKDLAPSYTLSLPPFIWKDLVDDINTQQIVHCRDRLSIDKPFYINVSGEPERICFEETSRKTMASSIYKVHLNPTVVFRNLLLYPVNYSIQGIQKDYLLPEGKSHELWCVDLGKTGLEIRLNNYLDRNWSCYKVLQKSVDELSVWVFEASSGEQKFHLELGMHTQKSKGSLVMQLYSPFCMINKTGMMLTYRRSKKYEKIEGKNRKGEEDNILHHPPNLQNPVLFSFKAKAFFAKKKASLKIADSEWSDTFSLDAVGSSGTLLAKEKGGKTYCIGIEIKLSQAGLTKMIIFTPYYLIVNNCKNDIEIKETAESDDWIKVPRIQEESNDSTNKDQALNCVPFWPKDANKAQMVVRYHGESNNTIPFSFKELHSTLLSLNSKMGGIHVDCQVAESSALITFSNYIPGQAAALLVNHMERFPIKFCQSLGSKEIILEPNSFILYTWENPLEKRLLHWSCKEGKGENDLLKDGISEFSPNSDVKGYWVSFLDDMQRVLLFTDDLILATAAQEAGELERIEQEITISLQGVGVSLVNNDTMSEIMYMGITSTGVVWEGAKKKSKRFKPLSVKDCDIIESAYQKYQNEVKISKRTKPNVILDDRIEIDFETMIMSRPHHRNLRRMFQTGLWLRYKTSPHQLQLHAKINRLQIDNQLTDCVFPVVLSPVAPPKSVAATNAAKPFTELSIMLRRAEHSSVPQFKYCKILIQEFHIKLDQGFINSILLFFTADHEPEIDHVKMLALDKEIALSSLKDLAAIYSTQDQKNFFDDLHFSPLKVHVSFSMTGGTGQDDNKPTPIRSDFVNLLLQSVGVTLTEIQDVVLRLDYFERKYVFMSQNQLIAEATSHYVNQSVKQLYMLVLGLDVIGNPVGLLLGLGEGVTDLFYEPFQGAIQGPEEFAEGLALGVKSLFGHAIGGAAGAASRIAGTLGKGIAALTLDKDYQKRRRQNITRRPQDFAHGIAESGKGLVMGVFDGVTGIVRKPLQGAQEEGVGGFFKGVGKGLIGVVTRPTAGVVDFTSGTLDAVKRATQLADDVKRLRVPRLIKPDGVIRPYVAREAEGNKLLQEVDKGKYSNTDHYYVHVPVETDKQYLLVTTNRIMYVERGELFGQWNTVWEYRFDQIKGFPSVTDKGLKIMLQNPQRKGIFSSKISGKLVHIKDKEVCKWLADKLQDIMKKSS